MTPDVVIERSPVLERRLMHGRLVRAPTPAATALVLDATAAALWDSLVEPVAVGVVAAELADAYAAPLDDVLRDVGVAVEALVDAGLVTIVDG